MTSTGESHNRLGCYSRRPLQQSLGNLNDELPTRLEIRIGINSSDVIAGVIGTHKFVYDIWGDAVNVASRLESTSLPGRIQVSRATYEHLRDEFVFEPRGGLEIKGKGSLQTYFLIRRV